MKTPRDILLKKHQPVEAKLDAVRVRALATAMQSAATADAPADSRSFGLQLWQELFWSCRRIWFGLGAAWVVIVLMNFASMDRPHTAVSRAAVNTPEMMAAIKERELLKAELLGTVVNPPADALPALPRPRSDARREEMFA